ncbi:type II secretion system major pseudopilin GspG [Salinisphaera hydrothermalis]|uniref:Type II secretion system core protein G n=1 Tax=Salinisphaera hydrothermalis (strain C41B8) TaxID=1304275 RepID=A0A084IQP3_SALHC|nr:type II secretion system major pseudopilin GspG [Salinisphaera hydrothermalis]KEZ79027.1 general secretion pathway protein G [Salinisphaera hydrothermalis C41B8]
MQFPRHRAATSPRRQSGFTLIEIMVVVVILGILAAIVVPNIIDRPDAAREAKARQDIKAIDSALKLYRLDNYRYPTTEQGLAALVTKPTSEPVPRNWKSGGYLDRLPTDPWGHVYHYRNPGQHGPIDIYTLGRDNQKGGDGPDADIGNWTLNDNP